MKKDIIIKKITPQGFCYGVVCAIKLINKILDDQSYPPPLYMLGKLVHNKHITNAYREKGIIILENQNDIEFHHLTTGTIIITAHGLSPKKKQQILKQGLKLIDATCPEVLKIQNLISEKIKQHYEIIYFGVKNHPECQAIMGIDSTIRLISSLEDLSSLDDLKSEDSKIFFTNQTTMFFDEVKTMIINLKKKFPNLEVEEDICDASKKRQRALLEQAKDCDLCLVIGDSQSNNTKKLRDICLYELHKPTLLIETFEEARMIDLTNIKKIAITAGASTPNKLVEEIIKVLYDSEYVCQLSSLDYLNIK